MTYVTEEIDHKPPRRQRAYEYHASEWWLTPLLLFFFHDERQAGVTLKTKTGAWERDNVHELFKKATKCSGYQILNKASFKANTSTVASI